MALTRGRPPKPDEEKVLNNGWLPRQWKRLRKEAKARGYADIMPYVRQIVDEYFAQCDAEAASAEDVAPVVEETN